jgi:2-oxoglutarate ferredoxin oxidoreductase subunit beta
MLDVISPCVTFNDHEGSTKSYSYVKDHDEPLADVNFVPYFEEISVDYDPGSTMEINMHDGSRLLLRKLEESYDPTNKIEALRSLTESHEKGEIITGLFYVNTKQENFLTLLNIVDEPLATLPEAKVRPPKEVLAQIMQVLM